MQAGLTPVSSGGDADISAVQNLPPEARQPLRASGRHASVLYALTNEAVFVPQSMGEETKSQRRSLSLPRPSRQIGAALGWCEREFTVLTALGFCRQS